MPAARSPLQASLPVITSYSIHYTKLYEVDQAEQEGGVGAGADRRVEIGDGSGPAEARVHHHHRGVVLDLRFDRPLEADRVRFGRVAALV